MKKLLIGLIALTSFSAFAQWSGDILCVKPEQVTAQRKLVADAKGRITVKMVDGAPVAQIAFSDLRLFSDYGSVRGSKMTAVTFSGDVGDGNDSWFANTLPTSKKSIIKDIQFDLSSLDRGLTTVTTLKGNKYEMDCVVRND